MIIYTKRSGFTLLFELLVFLLILVRLGYELKTSMQLSRDLTKEKDRTANLSGQLSATITAQFEQWKLTRSEMEIAWLMLKGYSFKEIAALRAVKEKTIRQQASSIYSKSGSNNRSEFNSLFFEDLMSGAEE